MTIINPPLKCESCDSAMHRANKPWHFVCKYCGLESSNLEGKINSISEINEDLREDALKSIRQQNFRILLNWMTWLSKGASNDGNKKALLDVGCAHGWFLEIAAEDYFVLGLEPDKNITNRVKKRNLNIRNGFFPSDLRPNEVFDAIVFNDVLEHIPSVLETLLQCEKKLSHEGVVIINAPNSRGIFYRTSKILSFFGFDNSFKRMWQVGLPSPHVYYFNDGSMRKIAEKAGFKVVGEIPLPFVTAKGLYSRITFVGNNSKTWSIFLYVTILVLIPILRIFPSDSSAWALMRKPS